MHAEPGELGYHLAREDLVLEPLPHVRSTVGHPRKLTITSVEDALCLEEKSTHQKVPVGPSGGEVRAEQTDGKDGDGQLVYLAPTRVNLNLTMERWPEVKFLATREL